MKTFFRLTAIILSLFSCFISMGQSSIVTGLIRDKSGAPLIGASITIDNNNSGTITDQSGHYKLLLTPGRHYITVSYIGYAEQIIILKVSDEKPVKRNFTLAVQYKIGEEAVVVAQSRSRNSNSLSKNSSSDQNKQTDTRIHARQLELPLLNNILDY